MPNHIDRLLYEVLKEYGVNVTYNSVEKSIKTHPDFPLIQSISDVLDSLKVKHVVMKLSFEELRALNVPVIAFLNNKKYVWVTKVTDSEVYYKNDLGKEKTDGNEHFEQEWSGVVLAIENIDNAGDPNYKEERNKDIKEKIFKYLIAGGFVVLLSILAFFTWSSDSGASLLTKISLFFVNAIGFYISYLLIRQEKNQSDALSDKFCKAGKHIDCKQVTSSRYSSFFGLISWAELGAAYFSSILLWIIITPLSDDFLLPLILLSYVVLPFTLLSLFTQALVIRKWCLFCCSIVFLLWVNAIILTVFYSLPTMISIPDTALMALLFLACLLAVIETSKSIGEKDRFFKQLNVMSKLKYNIKNIKAQLSEQKYSIENIGFTSGNPESRYDIGLYVSISCHHCEMAVKELRLITEIHPDFRYRIIFAVSSDNYDDVSNVIIRHFINLYQTMDKNSFFDMLDDWYKMPKKNPEALQEKYPVSSVQNFETEIDALYRFKQKADISGTPAIFIDGKILPRLYNYKDLSGIIRTLNAEDQ